MERKREDQGYTSKAEEAILVDLPGVYSLSPYTLEEVVSRNFLIGEKPDAIINIIDGTNLERNLYLTTQLTELGIPVIVAVNMMDLVRKNGEVLDIEKLGKDIGCKVVEISALRGEGIDQLAQRAVAIARGKRKISRRIVLTDVWNMHLHILKRRSQGA